MQKSQRPFDNPALNVAVKIANKFLLSVKVVVFIFKYPNANIRHYKFFPDGLMDTAKCLLTKGISFHLKIAEKFSDIPKGILIFNPKVVVMDENPIQEMEQLRQNLSEELPIPFITVDSDVVVPSRLFGKEFYNAKIFRDKYKQHLSKYLKTEKELLPEIKASFNKTNIVTLEEVGRAVKLNYSVTPVEKKGGYFEGERVLKKFVEERLSNYENKRNDPNEEVTSQLSSYLHFGHISPIRVALTVLSAKASISNIESFLDKLLIRRELAINFVKHNKNYKNLKCCENWALNTLEKHRKDFRKNYSLSELENGETEDPLWNAAQKQMVKSGFMHNYLRMYWAKQLIFWTKSPEEAFETAVYLNDKYQLDGRDPNGYKGIAWAIGGKHDRPFPPDKLVLGLIRPMTLKGAKRKFDVDKFCL